MLITTTVDYHSIINHQQRVQEELRRINSLLTRKINELKTCYWRDVYSKLFCIDRESRVRSKLAKLNSIIFARLPNGNIIKHISYDVCGPIVTGE